MRDDMLSYIYLKILTRRKNWQWLKWRFTVTLKATGRLEWIESGVAQLERYKWIAHYRIWNVIHLILLTINLVTIMKLGMCILFLSLNNRSYFVFIRELSVCFIVTNLFHFFFFSLSSDINCCLLYVFQNSKTHQLYLCSYNLWERHFRPWLFMLILIS